MVPLREKVTEAIYRAIDDVNQQLPGDQRLEKSLSAVLVGSTGVLDSLGMVNLMVASEEKIEQAFQTAVALTDELVLSSGLTAFPDVGALVDYVWSRLEA